MDKLEALLAAALHRAAVTPAEALFYSVAKRPGLFRSRAGNSGEAAALGLRLGYFEILREEAIGKKTLTFVRPTPAGLEWAAAKDSPRAVLEAMHKALTTSQAAVPAWMDDVLGRLQTLAEQVAVGMQAQLDRLAVLQVRVEQAIRRTEASTPTAAGPLSEAIPWTLDALTYLDHRAGACPMPELFTALQRTHPLLTILAFHTGLRRLTEHRLLRLSALQGPLPQPEYALPEGHRMLYLVEREGMVG